MKAETEDHARELFKKVSYDPEVLVKRNAIKSLTNVIAWSQCFIFIAQFGFNNK